MIDSIYDIDDIADTDHVDSMIGRDLPGDGAIDGNERLMPVVLLAVYIIDMLDNGWYYWWYYIDDVDDMLLMD